MSSTDIATLMEQKLVARLRERLQYVKPKTSKKS